MKIRRFEDGDARKACNMIKRSLRESVEEYPLEIIEALASRQKPTRLIEKASKGHFFVVEKGSRIVGIGGIVGAEIKTIFVHPDFQKAGVGKKIMFRIEEDAKSLGLNKVFLHAVIHAEKFYHKLGFKKKGLLKSSLAS